MTGRGTTASQKRTALSFDWFNLMNNNVVLTQVERLNQSTAGNITNLLAPRVARFGLKVDFQAAEY